MLSFASVAGETCYDHRSNCIAFSDVLSIAWGRLLLMI